MHGNQCIERNRVFFLAKQCCLKSDRNAMHISLEYWREPLHTRFGHYPLGSGWKKTAETREFSRDIWEGIDDLLVALFAGYWEFTAGKVMRKYKLSEPRTGQPKHGGEIFS